jgi:hypothetical protein
MKLTDYAGWLVSTLRDEQTTATELLRALREQNSHFNPDEPKNYPEYNPDILRARSGPGGGLDADPFRAGFVLIAIMLDGPRSDICRRGWDAWHINHKGSVLSGWGDFKPIFARCDLTGEHLFGSAVKQILAEPSLAKNVARVRLASDCRWAEIWHSDGKTSRFENSHRRQPSHLVRTAELDGVVVAWIAEMLKR